MGSLKGKIKNVLFLIGFALLVILFTNLADWAYETWITGNGYQFDGFVDCALPLVVGIVAGYIAFLHKQ